MTALELENVDAALFELEERRRHRPAVRSFVCPLDGCLVFPLTDQACPVCGVPVRLEVAP